jgi:hypothetical protein
MTTKQVLEILKVVAWIIFIGLCIKTGAMVISVFISLFVNSKAAKDLYSGLDLSQIYALGLWHYVIMVFLIVIVSGLKAFLFYQVAKITSKINITHPFSVEVERVISKMSEIALQIGIISIITHVYSKWLLKQNIHFTFEGESTEFLFLAGILFVIAVIFKRGIELQSENDLTI